MFEGENIVLRPWDVGDIESVVKYGNNRRIWRNLRDVFPHPYTEADAEAWIALNETDETFRNSFAIARDRECIGAASLMPKTDVHRKTVELGYWIGEPFWGRGYASEVLGFCAISRLGN